MTKMQHKHKDKQTMYTVVVIILLLLIPYIYLASKDEAKKEMVQDFFQGKRVSMTRDATYTIDGRRITLVGGKNELRDSPGSPSKTMTWYFGNQVGRDFDNNGKEDAVLVLVQRKSDGTIAYYVAPALQKERGYIGGEATLLGNRIIPEKTELRDGTHFVVYYLDRKPTEPQTAVPTVKKSRSYMVDVSKNKIIEEGVPAKAQ